MNNKQYTRVLHKLKRLLGYTDNKETLRPTVRHGLQIKALQSDLRLKTSFQGNLKCMRLYTPGTSDLRAIVSRVMSILASRSHRLIYAYRLCLWAVSSIQKKNLLHKIVDYFGRLANKAGSRYSKVKLGGALITSRWLIFRRALRTKRRKWSPIYKLGVPVTQYWSEGGREWVRLKDAKLVYQFYRQYLGYIFSLSPTDLWKAWSRFKRQRLPAVSNNWFLSLITSQFRTFVVKLGLCFDTVLAEEMIRLGLFKINSLSVSDPLIILKLRDILQVNYVAVLGLISYLNRAMYFSQLKVSVKKHWKVAKRITSTLTFIHSHWPLMLFIIVSEPLTYSTTASRSANDRWISWFIRNLPAKKRFVDTKSRVKEFTVQKFMYQLK